MIMLPIETPGHVEDWLVIVLEDDNLERMKSADPAEIKLKECGHMLVNPTILLCHEKPSPEFMKLLNGRDLKKIITYLRRGFEFRPDKGDHDRGPEKL